MHDSAEQQLLAHILSHLTAAGYGFPRPMVIDYYVSLKSNPFVILTGAQGYGKVDLTRLFAEAIVGEDTHQYILIRGGSSWPGGTGEERYFHALQARFSSLRFVETLHEAAAPTGEGKAFFICLESLAPAEVEYYFSSLLFSDESGNKRLRLPGMLQQGYPIVPPNVYITATINDKEQAYQLSGAVLDSASPIEFRLGANLGPVPVQMMRDIPPVGYQRIFMRSAVRRVDAAHRKLAAILGVEGIERLRPSNELSLLLWRAGIALSTRTLHELIRYVANAFDEGGHGLFAPDDPAQNALMALDSQIAQKVLWRLRGGVDPELQREVEAYLDRLYPYAYSRFLRMTNEQ